MSARSTTSVSRIVRFLLIMVLPAAMAAFALPGSASADTPTPTINSDQVDYAPGSIVTLTSSGWSADEAVHISVDDNDGQSWHFQDDVSADATGTFVEQVTLPDWFVATYAVQATGASGAIASTTFTDSNVQVGAVQSPSNTRIAVSVLWTTFKKDATCTGTTNSSGTTTTVTNNDGYTGTTGVGQQTAMSIQAQQSVVIGGHLWTFNGWTGALSGSANPLCVPGNTDNGKIFELASYVDSGVTVQQTQTITFAILPDKNFGDADFGLTATASSGLAVSFAASPSSVCTVSGTTVHLVGVGDCTITATQAGNATYLAATPVIRSFTVNPGTTTVTVNCPASVTYTGLAITPCSATATAAGGFSTSVTVTYSPNVNVGTVTASATFASDGTHAGGSGSTTFMITQASSMVNIICGSATFTGSALTPCSATATGAGLGTGVSLTPSYGNNINAGTNSATVSATWAGDTNHTGNSANTTFSIAKATSTTTITCASPVTYTGSAITACGTTATVTGAGGLSTTVAVTYPGDNTDVGTNIEADASYPGDANHLNSSDTKHFDISQAGSMVTITCHDVTYDTTAQSPCTAEVNGPNLHITGLTVTYDSNTNAGTANAYASWSGDANHTGDSETAHFTINKADTSVTVMCTGSPVYDGTEQKPCSASVSGPGLSGSLAVSYTSNIDAGTNSATASASYAGDSNYNPSSNSTTFSIAKAASTVTVDCSGTFTYTGSSQQPCSASVSGAGGLSGSVDVDYPADTTDAGTVNVSATYAGDDNHTADTGYGSYVINKADTTTTVTCSGPVTYSGSPLTPCSASVTGPALNQSLTVNYADNTNATLSASASATFAATTNYNTSSDTKYFVINQASSTTTLNCPGHVTYTGSALTPCTASVTGAGGLNSDLTSSIVYGSNTEAGSATASVSFGGDTNHLISSDSGGFTIDKAGVTVTVNCPPSVQYSGYAQTPCTASVSGAGLTTSSLTPTYTNNKNAGTNTASASASYAGDSDHNPGSNSATFAITKAPLTVTPDAKTMTYGDPVPTLTYTIGTFLGSDNQSNSTSGTPNCSTTATSSSPAGQYDITCNVLSMSSANYSIGSATAKLTVNAKGATINYNGSLMFSTGSTTATSASVTLSGQLNPGSGGSPNLLNAKPMTFNLYKSGNLTMATPDATCTTTNVNASGVFTCNTTLGIDNWTVVIHLGSPGNTFFNASDSDPVVLTVFQPTTDQSATGGGWINDPSAGISPTNTHGNFGFTVRYKGSSPQGQSVFTFRGADGNDYVVKSNSWQGGALAFNQVSASIGSTSFSGKCNVTVINRATGQVVASYGNYTFRVDAVDNGSPGATDSYAIVVYASNGTLFHQAGTTNNQLTLQGGNIVIHAK